MTTYLKGDRFMTVTTPLAKDDLLVVGLSGLEAISQLFSFKIDLLAENQTNVAFDKLLGQEIILNLALSDGKSRFFCGICNRASQGEQNNTFTEYHLEIVPQFWMLTRRAQSRIFQQISVPDILKKVLDGLNVQYEIRGTFHPRDYCVQYRETDFNFASRLMEEEGIYYFFKHEKNGHKMVIANTPQGHPALPDGSALIYEELMGGTRDEDRVWHWEKVQELRSGKVTLWDSSFELPNKNLEADQPTQDVVTVGNVKHKLKVGGNDKLELYDYPGEYAQRFDGIDPKGGDRPADLQRIFQDNRRTAGIRMQEESTHSLLIRGSGNYRQLTAGHKFSLTGHFNATGEYVLTSINHFASLTGNYRSGDDVGISYENHFTCIPSSLPYVPPRISPKPVIYGTQTAVVVGPPGEEIFTDKYSRVKVQFPWDREGKNDTNSSCWVRVGTAWAGRQWGAIHIPRIGQEVIVGFLEGDPDQPIIVGSVYNADQMPPYTLPANKTQSGIKTRSSTGGGPSNYNEIRFEDKKGSEQLSIHAEKNQDISVESDESHSVGHNRTKTIGNDETTHVKHDRTETVDNNEKITVANGTLEHDVATGTALYHVKGAITENYDDAQTTTVANDIVITSTSGKLYVKAATEIQLEVGQSKLYMDSSGNISLEGINVTMKGAACATVKGGIVHSEADSQHQTKGAIVLSEGSATNTIKGGVVMLNP